MVARLFPVKGITLRGYVMLKTMKDNVRYLLKGYIDSPFASKKRHEEDRFDLEKLPAGYFSSFGNKNPDKVFYVIWRSKYICLNHHIEEVLNDYYQLVSCRELGVHFRGQEQQLAVGHSFPSTVTLPH